MKKEKSKQVKTDIERSPSGKLRGITSSSIKNVSTSNKQKEISKRSQSEYYGADKVGSKYSVSRVKGSKDSGKIKKYSKSIGYGQSLTNESGPLKKDIKVVSRRKDTPSGTSTRVKTVEYFGNKKQKTIKKS